MKKVNSIGKKKVIFIRQKRFILFDKKSEFVNITPGFGPVSICMFPFVMHSAQW